MSEKVRDLMAALERSLADARVKFWDCPMNHPQEPRRERIRWEGDVATCLDCGRTNQGDPSVSLARVQAMATALVENGYGTPKAGKDASDVLASFDRISGGEAVRLREALGGVLGALSLWRPVQPSPDPTDCSAGYPVNIRRAWSHAIDVLGDDL